MQFTVPITSVTSVQKQFSDAASISHEDIVSLARLLKPSIDEETVPEVSQDIARVLYGLLDLTRGVNTVSEVTAKWLLQILDPSLIVTTPPPVETKPSKKSK